MTTNKTTVRQCERFATLVGTFAGFLDVESNGDGLTDALASDLLNLALAHGAPQSFVDAYQEWSAR